MHVELVETQHPAVAEQLVQGGFQGIGLLAVAEHAFVQPGEEIMEMQAAFMGHRQRLVETIQQPTLAAPHGAVQVQAARLRHVFLQQRLHALGHAVDNLLLAVAQGITLLLGLVLEVLGNLRPAPQVAAAQGVAQAGLEPGFLWR